MRHLAGTGHIPAITVVAGSANRAYTQTARVIHNSLLQAVRAAVFNHIGKIHVVTLDALAAGESLGILGANLQFAAGTQQMVS